MTIKNQITIEDALALLNEMNTLDAQATKDLVEKRVSCNEALADHPSIQTGKTMTDTIDQNDKALVRGHRVGLLGVLNGLFGANAEGWGPICAVFEDDGTLSHFKRTDRTIGKED